MNVHVHTDAAGRLDPTGTFSIRRAFRAELDKRWNRIRVMSIEAIAKQNFLNLGPPSVASIAAAASGDVHVLPHQDKITAFKAWFDEAVRQLIIGHDGAWVAKFIREAAAHADHRSKVLTGNNLAVCDPQRINDMVSMTIAELKGIADAASQQVVREVAHGITANRRPLPIARKVSDRIRAVGQSRSRQMAEYMIVKAFNSCSLSAFKRAGVTKVGTVAEHVRIAKGPHGKHFVRDAKGLHGSGLDHLFDAARKTIQKRHGGTGRFVPYTPRLTPAQQGRIERREAKLQAEREKAKEKDLDEVDVLTAGDDDVCFVCEDISDEGPYDLDEAEGLIPAHPFCRCAFVPAGEGDRSEGLDADWSEEDHPRGYHGRFGAGGAPEKAENEEKTARMVEELRQSVQAVPTPPPAPPAPPTVTPTPPPAPTGYDRRASRTAISSGYFVPSQHLEDHLNRVRQVVAREAAKNPTYRRGVTKFMEEGRRLGSGAKVQAQLRGKLAESYAREAQYARSIGDPRGVADRLAVNARREGWTGTLAPATPPPAAAPRPEAAPKPEGTKKPVTVDDFNKAGVLLPQSGQVRQITTLWDKKVGMSPEEFKQGFTGGVKTSNFTVQLYGDDVSISARVMDARGNNIGSFTRVMNFTGNFARSSYFSIREQGHGIGKKILAANVATYQKLGLSRLGVHANIDVGGYAWAKYGYTPTPGGWRELQHQMLDKARTIRDPAIEQLKPLIRSSDPTAVWAISDHALGKQLLLGTHWDGTLHFNDRRAMGRFNAYVHKG